MATMYAHVTSPPPLLSQVRPGLPSGANRVLARALAKDPAWRYGSCGELARELRQALGVSAYGDVGGGDAPPPGRAATALAANPTAASSASVCPVRAMVRRTLSAVHSPSPVKR